MFMCTDQWIKKFVGSSAMRVNSAEDQQQPHYIGLLHSDDLTLFDFRRQFQNQVILMVCIFGENETYFLKAPGMNAVQPFGIRVYSSRMSSPPLRDVPLPTSF